MCSKRSSLGAEHFAWKQGLLVPHEDGLVVQILNESNLIFKLKILNCVHILSFYANTMVEKPA